MKDTQPKIVCDNISKTFIQKGTQMVPVLEKVSLGVAPISTGHPSN